MDVVALRWSVSDLELFPEDDKRREVIDGELYVSTQPHYHHQNVCNRVAMALTLWSDIHDAGVVTPAPGIIFDDDDAVAPDVIWMSRQRLEGAAGEDGKYHDAPDLAVEVLSLGEKNVERDRDVKVKLYSRQGVQEYWILDWRSRKVEVYRRQRTLLKLVATLFEQDILTSPILPGFSCQAALFFKDIKRQG